jgi:hypothetical protein
VTVRDDFTVETKRVIAQRAGHRCSNPDCGVPTSGPQLSPDGSVNLGVAAHITGAAPGGPRYDPSLSSEKRSAIENALWLCQSCAKLVDNDPVRFTIEVLQQFRASREHDALKELGRQQASMPLDPKLERLSQYRNEVWTIRAIGRRIFKKGSVSRSYRETGECSIEKIDNLMIDVLILNEVPRLRITIPIGDMTLSFDSERCRQMIELRR